MAKMVFDDLVNLARSLGQPVSSQRLPASVVAGPFCFAVDLGTALTDGQDVTDLTLAATVEDPQLALIGFNGPTSNIGYLLWGAKLLLGGTSVQRLNPTDMAHLNSNLYLRLTDSGNDQFKPLSGMVRREGVAVQELQAMAANALNFADAEPRPGQWATPLYVPNVNGVERFSLYNREARTFTTPADPDLSKLLLYGIAFKAENMSGAPDVANCGSFSPAVLQELAGARLVLPNQK
jgi:hypothetical protein